MILSFDIGLRNFAYYIEKEDGNIKMDVVDILSLEDVDGDEYTIQLRKKVIETLDGVIQENPVKDILQTTVLIEQQYFNTYSFGKKTKKGTEANIKAIKVAETVTTYFLIKLNGCNVVHVPSSLKTKALGAPAKLTKPQRKKWAIEKAMELLSSRGDTATLDFLTRMKKVRKQKLDDVCDAMLQCEAWKLQEK
jgi:hypothetical protein